MMVLAQHQILRVCCNSHMGILCIPRNWRRRPVRFLERHGEAADASVSGPRLLKCRGSTEQLAKELLLLVERKMKQTDSWRQSCEAEKEIRKLRPLQPRRRRKEVGRRERPCAAFGRREAVLAAHPRNV